MSNWNDLEKELLADPKVKKEYDKLATRFAVTSSSIFPTPIFGNWITIDADRPIKEVRGQVKDLLHEYLLLRKK